MKTRLFAASLTATALGLVLTLIVAAQGASQSWLQVNTDGFGSPGNTIIMTLATFRGHLYAGTYNPTDGDGGQLWHQGNDNLWTAVTVNGFGVTNNVSINHLISFDNRLYASTWNNADGGEIWRSEDAVTWTRVVSQGFDLPTNQEIMRLAVFNNVLYASTKSYTSTHGAEVWRSNSGNTNDWTRSVANGYGDANNREIMSLEVSDGYLYAGTFNDTTGGEVWRTNDGINWTQVNAGGFGLADNTAIPALATFKGYLYASTRGHPGFGAQVWRCQGCDNPDGWDKVVDNAFGNPNSWRSGALEVFAGNLYLVASNSTTGLEVWCTTDGTNWKQINVAGFGDVNNWGSYRDNNMIVHNNSLYLGTWNPVTGGEIWMYLPVKIFLPAVIKQ